jgi:nitrate/TMAO reductase-like tetraheme cytochrome c subunit
MPRRLFPRFGALTSFFICMGMLCISCFIKPAPVMAAPYTVRNVEHPFDPDWPDVYLILAVKCAGCHRPGAKETDLTSYQAVIDAKSADGEPLVIPGRPDESAFFKQLIWNDNGDRNSNLPDEPAMPEDPNEWLTGQQLAAVRNWIARGALEYKLPDGCSSRPLLEIDFPSAKECKVCHPKQYTEWSRSMHAYAQHSPVMEAFNLTLIERTSGTIGTFCVRCHTPLGTALGENGSRRNVNRSRLSMEGVTCVVCHRMTRPYYKSNVRQAILPGKLLETCMFGPFDDSTPNEQRTHLAAGNKYLKKSSFCGMCHDVTSPQGVRLEEAFSEWQHSPAAKQGVTCQQCHMGPIQGVPIADDDRPLGPAARVPGVDPKRMPLRRLSNHSFAGPDYSMLPDTEFPEKLDCMYEIDYRDESRLSPYHRKTLNQLRRRNRRQLNIAREKRYELLQNAADICVKAPRRATAGDRIKVRVDVISKLAGHNFPTGFTAERQAWVEITLTDAAGRVVFQSGDLDRNGDLRDAHSHYVERGKLHYDRHLLNMQSKFVALTARGTERPVTLAVNRHLTPLNILRPATGIAASFGRPPTFRLAKSSLPPLKTLGQVYPVRLPDRPGYYRLDVKLNFRNFPPALFDRIGTPHLKHLLEVVEIERHQSIIEVTPHARLPFFLSKARQQK